MIKTILIVIFISFPLSFFAQEFDAELVNQETNIEISKGKLTKNVSYEIKINNRGGEKYTKVTIPYSKLIKISNIDAYIIDSYGQKVKKLKQSQITDRNSISYFSLYEDDFVKEFTLKHNSYPYTIAYSYEIKEDEFIQIVDWTPLVHENIQTRNARLILSVPKDYSIAYKNQLVNEPKVDTVENSINYQWETSYKDIVKPEEYSPPLSNFWPSVSIVPVEFYYDKNGSFKNWASFGNWQNDLLQELSELPENEKSKIRELIQNTDADKEKLRILYHYLQDETRYINVSVETGGLKPYPASYVAQNKYGDCKALTNYFKSVLDYVNIPSYYTKVHAGSPIDEIEKDFPSQQSNHIILYVPLKDEDIWLDCTSDGPFNYLGTFSQNRDALIICKDSSSFVKTPALKPKDVFDTRRIEINYSSGDANAKFINTCRGDEYETILDLERNYNESEKVRILRNYFVEDGFQIIDYEIHHKNRDSVVIELKYNATSQSIYKHYGNDILVNNIPFLLPDLEKPNERKLPIQIDYPIYKIDTLIYEKPAEYKLNTNNNGYSLSNKYGEYSFKIKEDTASVIVIKSLLINAGFYPKSEYGEFYEFYDQIIEIENKTHITLYK